MEAATLDARDERRFDSEVEARVDFDSLAATDVALALLNICIESEVEAEVRFKQIFVFLFWGVVCVCGGGWEYYG